jgi:hypothetical protein
MRIYAALLLLTSSLPFGCSRAHGTSVDGGSPSPPGSTAAATPSTSAKAFGAYCVEDTECASAVCFHKRLKTGNQGPEHRGANDAVERDGFCSMSCNSDADCPVPPTNGRCGARGMCKRPE